MKRAPPEVKRAPPAESEVSLLLYAYVADGNPWHVIDAHRILRRYGLPIRELDLKNLDAALDKLRVQTRTGAPPKWPINTVRDLQVIGDVLYEEAERHRRMKSIAARFVEGELPAKLQTELRARLAGKYEMSPAAVSQVVSRWRRKFDGARSKSRRQRGPR